MRDLIKHPITLDEVKLCLVQLSEKIEEESVGDMRPILLSIAADIVEVHIKWRKAMNLESSVLVPKETDKPDVTLGSTSPRTYRK